MRCKYCGIENNDNAQFCRNCGKEISRGESVSINVMDKFPKYNFVPTNFYDWRKPWVAKVRTIIVGILLVLSSILLMMVFIDIIAPFSHHYEYDTEYREFYVRTISFSGAWYKGYFDEKIDIAMEMADKEMFAFLIQCLCITIGTTIFFSIVIFLGIRKYPQKDNHLFDIADYVEKYRYTGFIKGRKKPILKFYVKDNKMGLLDVAHYRTFLSAQYDKLSWREKNKYLNATVGNREFIIDIYGKELK